MQLERTGVIGIKCTTTLFLSCLFESCYETRMEVIRELCKICVFASLAVKETALFLGGNRHGIGWTPLWESFWSI